MKKLNLVVSLLLAALLIFGQIGAAQAAPASQEATPEPPLKGIVIDIDIKDLDTDNPYVKVEIELEDGTTEKVNLSLETAEALGLITKDGDTYTETELDDQNPLKVEIAANDILPEEETQEGFQHPIGLILEMFFGEDLNVDYAAIMTYHETGVGFGVLAQAMWMTKNVEGDAELLAQIVEAKKSGDFSKIVLPDGSTLTMADGSAPKNWGQVRKLLLEKGNNLGATKDKDNGKPEDKGTGKPDNKGNNKDKDKDKDKDNGNGNNNP